MHQIFLDIREFIVDYIKYFDTIHENIIKIKLDRETFLLPATLNDFSQRADELQHQLQNQIRILAQKRRNNISKGIDDENPLIKSCRFNNDFIIHLEQLQKNIVDKNIDQMIRYIRAIID